MSQIEAGNRLEMDDKKLSRIETGQIPDVHLLRSMLDLYGVLSGDWNPYVELWRRAKVKGWWRKFRLSNAGYIAQEADACLYRSFALACIPGLLQTPAYVRELYRNTRVKHSRAAIEKVVTIRLKRAERLFDESPLAVHVVLDENCLRYKFPREVMREQLQQLLDRSELPNVTIQIVADPGPYIGMDGPFLILGFPDPDEEDIVAIEHPASFTFVDKPEFKKKCQLDFEYLAKLALSPEDTKAYLRELMAQL